jgi:hypothetical protein
MGKVTVVLTSCGRLELLRQTVDSFLKFCEYPIEEFIIIDDSGNKNVHEDLKYQYSAEYFHLILNEQNIGLIPSIDKAYSKVRTPFIFHTEDDWEFTRAGFIEKSVKILQNERNIMQVWLRGDKNPNGHPIEPEVFETDGVQYKLVGTYQHSVWHGFTFNPGLRRLSEYNLIKPYDDIHLDENRGIGVQENHIGRVLFEQYGFRAATLLDEYCYHTGDFNRTYANPSSMKANK